MKAILKFRDLHGDDLISGISQGQDEGSHKNLHGANDFMGTSAADWVDLLAPYDCKVMAIARADNAVFFQSLYSVETPIGKFPHCWFVCYHMNDKDFDTLKMRVGKVFKQGEPCYTEGIKGIGGGRHIHMEQGAGEFGGGSAPYYRSTDTYKYNGLTYYQYYPNVKDGGYEYPVYDMFFIPDVKQYYSSYEGGKSRYKDKWVYLTEDTDKDLETQLREANATIKRYKEVFEKITELLKELA